MSLLLKLIPEPYATLLLAAAVAVAWLYGDLTGSARQAQKAEIARQKSEIATLSQTVETMERQRQAAIEIQTKMAQRLSEVRVESQKREKQTNDLVEQLRAKPAAGACLLDDARRLRLQAIRIGPAGAHSGAR
ncbi:hypothetical protein [Bosea minatitlanensis]|uniref:DUF2570 domain-containing protein n=1 Tax=Bosea minatitlanensis TaxID=128782 RepID=A0ABW0F1F0_9HYPH|nr:hypothetical protein [Bosea minatitlanensis]MCT4491790.1 hypothetical protein [Bosea minatitlanensis]